MTEQIDVKQDDSIFNINIYEETYECAHNDYSVSLPCCNSIGDSGYIECDCAGKAEVICNNPLCTGIDEDDVYEMYDRSMGGGTDCET